jgi:hypothetical protein
MQLDVDAWSAPSTVSGLTVQGGFMQACQMCGAAEVDAGGCCTGCGRYRGTLSYAVAEPTPYGEPEYPVVDGYAAYPVDAGSPVSPAAAYHPVSPAPYGEDGRRPARGAVHTPLFLLTVMVVVLVIGSVSVVLIRTGDDATGAGGATQSTPATVAPASASPSASTVVDRCVVGDWAVTSLTVKAEDLDLFTDAGGIFHLRADGTGTWDFGSGITLKGTYEGVRSEDLITGRVAFGYRTVGQSFSFQNVQNDVREVLSQGRNAPVNTQTGFDLHVAEYTCAGDVLRLRFGGFDLQMGRK